MSQTNSISGRTGFTPFVVVVGGNIFCRCLAMLFIIAVWVGATGCGRKLAPVSFDHVLKDSITSVLTTGTIVKDSSTLKETFTEKTLPGATIGIRLNKSQMDSLIRALGNLPKGQAVTVTDPKLLAQLKFVLTANNELIATCTALDRQYNEKMTERLRYISKLEEENKSLKATHSDKSDTVVKEELNTWGKIIAWIKKFTIASIAIALIIVCTTIGLFAKFKFR